MLKKLLWAFHVPAGILLILSAHSRLVDPVDFWPAAFLGLGFMVLLFINIFFLLIWVLWWSRRTFFALLVMLLSIPTLGRYIRFGWGDEVLPPDERIRVMSYNVRAFDLYDWNNNSNTRDSILGTIGDAGPDILCLQEFFNSDDPTYFPTREPLLKQLNPLSEHIVYTTTRRKIDHWGMAIFSKYPMVNNGEVTLPEAWNNACTFADLVKGTDTIRVYNLHLASIGLSEEDHKLMENLNGEVSENEIERTRGILTRLKTAFIKRSTQAAIIREHINHSPYPVIVCGDFNDTPASYSYQLLRKGLKDSYLEQGSGLGITYPGLFPAYRIDYILVSPQFLVKDFSIIRQKLSDHYPVISDLKLVRRTSEK